MRTVFTNTEIMHVFNEQNQHKGRTSNNSIYFYDNKIYSYGSHYLLGKFIDKETIIINDEGYSNSTSKHISLLINATRNRRQFFTTKIETNIVLRTIKDYLNKFTRARTTKEFCLFTIDKTLKMYFDYLEYTKQKTKYNKIKEHREIKRISNNFYNNFDNLEKQIKEQQKKQAIKNKKEVQKKLKDWKENKINWISNKTNSDYLRINSDNVETSQGVKIPITEAKRILKLIELKKVIGQKIDNRFVVTSFKEFLKVGCHNISLKEINYIKELI
ncbi:MAG: hypothetical protein ABF250_08285 [Polaribacter sp.]|uniref:hypothetical protein n=1 Tax=Polaribacter sp. TaxID=1920175 RepID=UPI00321BDF69